MLSPVMFAIDRLPGWLARRREMVDDRATTICRPRPIYVGPTLTDYVHIEPRA